MTPKELHDELMRLLEGPIYISDMGSFVYDNRDSILSALRAAEAVEGARDEIARLTKALAEEEWATKFLDESSMDANDKLAQLAALVIDLKVASPYGQKVKAFARYCMNEGPDPLQQTYAHEQEGSESFARSALSQLKQEKT